MENFQEQVAGALAANLSALERQLNEYHPDTLPLSKATARAVLGGKMLRPLVLGEVMRHYLTPDSIIWQAGVSTAVAIELIHAALIIHDDVIDDDFVRRGQTNVAGEFRDAFSSTGQHSHCIAKHEGRSVAVIAGDLCLVRGLQIAAFLKSPQQTEIMQEFFEAVTAAAAGEYLDLYQSWPNQTPATQDLATAAHLKTTLYSFTLPMVAGGHLGGASDAQLLALRKAAEHMGAAFQIIDDLLGAFDHEKLGREHPADLLKHRETAVISVARECAVWPQVDELREAISSSSEFSQQLALALELKTLLARAGIPRLTFQRAETHLASARQILSAANAPVQPVKTVEDLLNGVVSFG